MIFIIPNAGGGYAKGSALSLNAAILKDIHFGEKSGIASQRLKDISKLFGKADIKVEIEENMLHWLWIHFAINSGLNSAMVKAGGAKNFMSSAAYIEQGIINAKEALKVCKARDVELDKFGDARTFSMPANLLAVMLKLMMKANKLSAKVMLEYKGAEELKGIYKNVVLTAKQLNVSIPNLESMAGEVEKAEKYLS